MSYGVKYTCTHKADTNNNETTYVIDILKKNYVGSATEVLGNGEVFNLEYDRVDTREPFKEPIQKSVLEFYLTVGDNSQVSILNEIFDGDEDEYQLRLKKDGTIIWTGWVLNDLLQYSNGDYPYRAIITAKDLTRLSQFTYALDDTRQKVITTIADLLDDLNLGLDIYTYTNWDNDDFPSTDDFLNLTYHETRALREYKKNGDEDDQPQNNEFWLDAILRNFGLIVRQTGGAWRIYQLSGMTGATVQEYKYNSSGVQQSSATPAILTAPGTELFVLPSSNNLGYPAIKRAEVVWNHRNTDAGIQLPLSVELEDNESETFTQQFLSEGTQSIKISGDIFCSFPEPTGLDIFIDSQARIDIKVVGTSTYFLQDDLSWSTDSNIYEIPLQFTKPQVGGGFDARGSFNITTDDLPADADGILNVIFRGANNDEDFADETTYTSLDFRINNETVERDSETLSYSLTQDGNFSYVYDHGSVFYGDGPVKYADSALRYNTGDDNITSDGWKRVGEGTSGNFFKLLLREFVDLQAVGLRVLEAELYGDFPLTDRLNYEATKFFFLGGSLNGQNVLRAEFLGIEYSTPTVTLGEIVERPSNAGFSGGGAVAFTELGTSYQKSQYITQVSTSLTGAITSIPINPVSEGVGTVGDPIFIFNIQSGVVDEFTMSESYIAGATSIEVESASVTGTVPRGSWIIYTGDRLSSYITQTDDAIRLGVSNSSVALTDDDDILITEDGDELRFVDGDYESDILRQSSEIAILQGQIVLKVTSGGNLALIDINGNADDGSEITIQADQITVAGQTTFISNTVSEINNGSTTIDGGVITTGSVTADQIDVSNLFSQEITVGTGGFIQSSGYDGTNGFKIQSDGTADFQKVTIGGSDSLLGDDAVLENLSIEGTLTINTGGSIQDSGYSAGSSGFQISADGSAEFNNVTVRGTVEATSGSLSALDVDGTITVQSGGSIVGTNYSLDDSGGNIAGWLIESGTLRSASAGNARIELNKDDNRVAIFGSDDNEDVVMGFLNGLTKNDGSGTWGSNDYGFWASSGDRLVIDGDTSYESGDWIVENDGSFRILNNVDEEIVRLGTHNGEKGLFIFNNNVQSTTTTDSGRTFTTGQAVSQFVEGSFFIGKDTIGTTNYVEYDGDTATLTVRGTLNADDIEAGSIDASVITVNNLDADNITTGTLTGNYVAGTSGFSINADTGSAEFNDVTVRGTIEATDGSIDGTLEMGSGGEIVNANGDYTLDDDGLTISTVDLNDIPAPQRYLKFGDQGRIFNSTADQLPPATGVISNLQIENTTADEPSITIESDAVDIRGTSEVSIGRSGTKIKFFDPITLLDPGVVKQTVSGNDVVTVLESLLDALDSYGLILDSSNINTEILQLDLAGD